MKKVRIFILFMTLFLGMFFFMPARVSAYTYNSNRPGDDFTPYINDIVTRWLEYPGDIVVHDDGTVVVFISASGIFGNFQFHKETDFSSVLLPYLYDPGAVSRLRDTFGVEKIYWNPWLQIWQLAYPVNPEEDNETVTDWYNHISQFESGFAKGGIDDFGHIFIVEEPGHEYEGRWIPYYGDSDWFEPDLDIIDELVSNGEGVLGYLKTLFEDFDGFLYWNFGEGYWQIEPYGTSELDYYKQRVEELEDEINLLEDEIQDLADEISLLEDEIQDLENEIQQLEDALDLEYDRGYNEGYQVGYSDGLLVENNDIDIIKWFVPLVVIIIVVGIIEPIILCKRRG